MIGFGNHHRNNNTHAIQQDVVKVIVKKLDGSTAGKTIDDNIISKTQEQLRLLEIKVNRKLSPLDSKEVRAVILLDYVCREEKGTRLDPKELMKALNIGTKNKSKFTQLYEMIGNYRQSPPQQQPTIKPPAIKQQKPTTRGGALLGRNLQQHQHQPASPDTENSDGGSIIPRLAIRLSSLILDPNGFAKQAQQLFEDIQEYVHTLKMPRRSDQLTDIQRFYACYEAACLYHVVGKTQTKKLARVSKQQKQKISLMNNNNHNNESAEHQQLQQNRRLEMDDILLACPNFSDRDFKQVCKHVETLVMEMEEDAKKTANKKSKNRKNKKKQQQQAKKGRKRGSGGGQSSTDMDTDPKRANNRNKKQKQQQGREQQQQLDDKSSTSNNNKSHDDHWKDDLEVPTLEEWRKQVIEDACEKAKKDLMMVTKEEGAVAVDDKEEANMEKITKESLLAYAADDVLRRFGLL